MNEMKKTIIVMPVANEEETMGGVLDEILALPYDNLYIYPVIDNYSKDQTENIIREREKITDKVKCIFYKESRGVISCYLEGFRRALQDGAECIIEMDGGGSHSPKEIPQFIEKLEEGYECVWGSRFVSGGGIENHPLYRRILSKGGTILSNLVLGTKLKDMTSGFEAFQRQVLEEMDLDAFLSQGHMYQTEMRYYCRNKRTIEVPIHYIGGSSSLKGSSVTEALRILFELKKNESRVKHK
jgi:dolichol-phosphate mannosyltransferase